MADISQLKNLLDKVNAEITNLLVKDIAEVLANLPKIELGTVSLLTVNDSAGSLQEFISILPATYLKIIRSNSYFVFCMLEHKDMLLKLFDMYNTYPDADWKAVISELRGWDFSITKATLRKHVSEQLG